MNEFIWGCTKEKYNHIPTSSSLETVWVKRQQDRVCGITRQIKEPLPRICLYIFIWISRRSCSPWTSLVDKSHILDYQYSSTHIRPYIQLFEYFASTYWCRNHTRTLCNWRSCPLNPRRNMTTFLTMCVC